MKHTAIKVYSAIEITDLIQRWKPCPEEFVSKTDYDEVRDLIQWLFDGIEHFTNEEDESQRNHLRNRAYEFLNKVSR